MKILAFIRVCAFLAIGAAVILGANGSFAAEDGLENLPGMPSAANNVWRYYAQGEEGNPISDACIVKGDWIIGATYEEDKGELWLGYYHAGEGVLNMLRTILEMEDGTQVAPAKIIWNNGWSMAPVSELWMTDLGTTIKLNSDGTTNSFGGLPKFGVRGTKKGNSHIRRIYIKSDVLEWTGEEKLINCYNLTNIILRCPNLVKWNGSSEGILRGTSITNDISEVVSRSVQEISSGAFGGYLTGTLVSTNQMGQILSFGQCTNVYLRGDNYEGDHGAATEALVQDNTYVKSMTLIWPKIESLGSAEWTRGSVLEDFTVYMPKLTNVYAGAMTLASKRVSTTILGPVLSTNVVRELVRGMSRFVSTATEQHERGILYCSKDQGWGDIATELVEGTYEAEHAPADCFGVFVGHTRVYMVNFPQDSDRKIFCIRIR